MLLSKSLKGHRYPRWIMPSLLWLIPAIAAADSGNGTAEIQSPAHGEADCKAYKSGKKEYLIKYDAASGRATMPKNALYDGASIVICIDNDDLRNRYHVTTSVTNLPPPLDVLELLEKAPFGKARKTESASVGKSGNESIDGKKRLNYLLEEVEVYFGIYLFVNKISRTSLPDVLQQFDRYSRDILLAIRAMQSPAVARTASGGGADEGAPLPYDSEEYRGSDPAKPAKGAAAPAAGGAAPARPAGGDGKCYPAPSLPPVVDFSRKLADVSARHCHQRCAEPSAGCLM